MFVAPPPTPSPQAQELGRKVADLVRIYKTEYTKMSFLEVRQAMRLAEKELSSEFGGLNTQTQALLVGLILFVVLFTGLLFFFNETSAQSPHLIMMVVLGLAVLALAVFVVVKRR